MLHQIQVAIYHPEVSKKTLLSVLDSKMTRFGAMLRQIQVAIYHPEVSKNALPKSLHFWGSPFLDPFCPDPRAICLKTWSPVQNPLFGPCYTISRLRFTIFAGPFSTFFYLGSLFGHLRMVKHTEEIVWHGPKSGPIQNVTLRTDGTDMRKFGSVGPACS